jgi:hypothetical protein
MNKQAMVNALSAFIGQRSGMEWGNYQCGDWKQSREAFMGDYRPILKHGKHARQMLRFVERCDSITAENLKEASSAYSGRLQFVERGDKVGVEYTTGQYFPTEYRNAACAVLACAIWNWLRFKCNVAQENIRKTARNEFGRGLASVWFA